MAEQTSKADRVKLNRKLAQMLKGGVIMDVKYLLGRISENRVKEMQAELVDAFDRVSYSTVKNVIFNNSGFRMNEI